MSIILISKGLNMKLFPYGFSQVVGKKKRCPCGIEPGLCKSNECKILGEKIGIKVGLQICEHNIQKYGCKKCGGSRLCKHGVKKGECKKCGGSAICEHNVIKYGCKKCRGGSLCIHERQRSRCKECSGNSICEHNKRKNECSICEPEKYIISIRRARRNTALRNKSKISSAKEDLGITLEEWYKYLEHTFENTYGRKRTEQDKVHIDEIIPCSGWNLPDDNKYCWHYLNSQFLLAEDNQSKFNQYDEKDKLDMIERIKEISVE